ncbi:MAG: hypothetical protein NXI15_05565 [Gammaproteobacteria bacterium]|nr:hypothetical protein [Gammaproteobacteria bacterium]
MKRFLTMLTTALLLSALPSLADATHPALNDTHYFQGGVFSQSAETTVSASRDGEPGSSIDLDNLDVDDNYLSWTLAYQWRFADRWSLNILGHTFDTDGSTRITDSFEFDGTAFEAGASLDSEFSVDALLIDVFYSVYRSDQAELQLGIGLHAFDFSVSFDAAVFAGDLATSRTAAADDLLAPLPNIRLHGVYALTPKWAIYGGVGLLSANAGDYDGRYLFGSVKTDYRITDRFAVGVGYEVVDVDLTYAPSSREVVFDVQFYGPTAFVSYSF